MCHSTKLNCLQVRFSLKGASYHWTCYAEPVIIRLAQAERKGMLVTCIKSTTSDHVITLLMPGTSIINTLTAAIFKTIHSCLAMLLFSLNQVKEFPNCCTLPLPFVAGKMLQTCFQLSISVGRVEHCWEGDRSALLCCS